MQSADNVHLASLKATTTGMGGYCWESIRSDRYRGDRAARLSKKTIFRAMCHSRRYWRQALFGRNGQVSQPVARRMEAKEIRPAESLDSASLGKPCEAGYAIV